MKEHYLIVRVDHRIVPAIVEYETDTAARFSSFRSSAATYPLLRETATAADRMRQVWACEFRVVGERTSKLYYSTNAR